MRTVAAHPQLIGIVAHVRLTASELCGADASSSPVVTFSYVDPGYAGVAGFANHLNVYAPLLRSLLGGPCKGA